MVKLFKKTQKMSNTCITEVVSKIKQMYQIVNKIFQNHNYHRFQFYATVGVFLSEENCVSAAVNHTIYGASTKLLLSVLQT